MIFEFLENLHVPFNLQLKDNGSYLISVCIVSVRMEINTKGQNAFWLQTDKWGMNYKTGYKFKYLFRILDFFDMSDNWTLQSSSWETFPNFNKSLQISRSTPFLIVSFEVDPITWRRQTLHFIYFCSFWRVDSAI